MIKWEIFLYLFLSQFDKYFSFVLRGDKIMIIIEEIVSIKIEIIVGLK